MAHIHFIGIGGSGLSAMARLLLERGETVSGSDRLATPVTQALQAAGASVSIGHAPENVRGAELVVRSSAIPTENPEVQAALAEGIPVLKRSDFLGQLMGGQTCLAVAGTHGKTTTTAMLAYILDQSGQAPSFIIGGLARDLGTNARAGGGRYFVIEADEYDHMFLGLSPLAAIVTNVEHDHPDCYPTPADFEQAFQAFSDRILPGGVLIACADDPGAARLLAYAASQGIRTLPYGLTVTQGWQAANLHPVGGAGYAFDARRNGQKVLFVQLQVPGRHNVLNALGVLALCDWLGLPLTQAAAALEHFSGTGRRFEVRGAAQGITVIDDYAHHPTEIRATLSAARQRYPGAEIWAVWQPHTFSRTRTLLAEFLSAFEGAEHVIITDIYAARESQPSDGFSAANLSQDIQHGDARHISGSAAISQELLNRLQPGAVLLVLSAGDADQISAEVLAGLQSREKMTHE